MKLLIMMADEMVNFIMGTWARHDPRWQGLTFKFDKNHWHSSDSCNIPIWESISLIASLRYTVKYSSVSEIWGCELRRNKPLGPGPAWWCLKNVHGRCWNSSRSQWLCITVKLLVSCACAIVHATMSSRVMLNQLWVEKEGCRILLCLNYKPVKKHGSVPVGWSSRLTNGQKSTTNH